LFINITTFNLSAIIIANKINKRYIVFPGSDPNILLKKLTSSRETYIINKTILRKEKPTVYINTFILRPTFYDINNKHANKDRSKNR
jgi:hypothetical protein